MVFKKVMVEDCSWAGPLLERSGFMSCEFAFVNTYIWSTASNTTIARYEDFFLARSFYDRAQMHYQYPAGKGDLNAVIEAILQDARDEGTRPTITAIPEECVPLLEKAFPGYFFFSNPRGQSNYVYNAADLAELPGKKYQKKRNHCSRFEREHADWQFLPITEEALPAVFEFNNRWCNLYDNRGNAGLMVEHAVIEKALRHYSDLRIHGGYLVAGGEVMAFSFGSHLNSRVFVTHVEKALYDVTGAYAVINREMAKAVAANGYEYINREDDVGEEGLRDAKLSYHPAFMVDNYTASPINWP